MLFDLSPFDASDAPPPVEAPLRPGATLGAFAARRRSPAIGRRFWRLVAENWADFDCVERARGVRMFARFRPDWTRDALALADRAAYDALPEAFTLYRGQNGVELAAGAAFTLSREAARGYALGRAAARPTVLALEARKREVALVFAGGDGAIVLFPRLRGPRPAAQPALATAH